MLARIALSALLLGIAADTAAAASAPAQIRFPLWATNGAVTAIATLGDTVYLGGGFTLAGPNTGGFVALDRSSAKLESGLPRVTGSLTALVSDQAGGWFLGGQFVAVDGLPRAGLAHVLADGSLADWDPRPNGTVNALAFASGVLFVGGDFLRIGGAARAHLGAIDPSTGRATEWRADTDQRVNALLAQAATLYVGGEFEQVAGESRLRLAEVSLRSGRVTSWNPTVQGSWVGSIARVGGTIYVGGQFWQVGSSVRLNLAAVSAGSGKLTAWDPDITDCRCDDYHGSPYVRQLLPSGDGTIYVAGHFTVVGGQQRWGIAEVDLQTGEPTPWSPGRGSDYRAPYVYCMALGDQTVYVGADADAMGGRAQAWFTEVDRKTGLATSWDPHCNAPPSVLVVREGSIYAGGPFVTVNAQKRNALAAMDLRTGELTDWSPGPSGFGYVETLAAGGGQVYAGGYFSELGGKDRQFLAALDPVTGVATDFRADADGIVGTLSLAGDRLYVGGDFARVNGVPRLHVAAVDPVSGELADWNPAVNGRVTAIVPEGETVYLAGPFRKIGDTPHASPAAVDAVTGTVRDWGFASSGYHNETLAVSDGEVIVGGNSCGDYECRDGVVAFDKATGRVEQWFVDLGNTRTIGSNVRDMVRVGDVLYVGGDFDTVGTEIRGGLAALDVTSGRVLNWNPRVGGVVWGVHADESGVYAGGNLMRAGWEPVGNIVALTPAQAEAHLVADVNSGFQREPVLAFAIAPNPVREAATVHFMLRSPSQVSLGLYDVRGRRIASLLEGALLSAGAHQVRVETSSLTSGIYFCRLDLPGSRSTRKVLVLSR